MARLHRRSDEGRSYRDSLIYEKAGVELRLGRFRLESICTFECALAPSLVSDDGHRIGEVEAAIARAHRNAQLSLAREAIEHVDGKPSGFRAEEKGIPGAEFGGEARCAGASRESENSRRRDAREKNVEILVLLYPGRLVIIKPGATKACFV